MYLLVREVPRRIVATGTMRSTTRVGGLIVEDTDGTLTNPPPHEFIALGFDRDSPQVDRFEVHFRTPFWNTSNPLCTVSEVVEDGCRFGGDLFLGNINATKSSQF